MYISETYAKKWAPVLDHPELPGITDPYKRAVTALVLENQEAALRQENAAKQNLWEVGGGGSTPVSGMGSGINGLGTAAGGIQGFDPIMIGLVRRAMPNLMAYDLAGVQPMTGPTGLIFAMRSSYVDEGTSTRVNVSGTGNAGKEAFYNEANTVHSGEERSAGDTELDLNLDLIDLGLDTVARAFSTTTAESANLNQMSFQIDRVAVEARSRGLQASYSLELAQDLKAVHGLDAETELSNILSTEILAEINREVVRTVYATAMIGVTASGESAINLSSSNVAAGGTTGRWQVEKYKSLLFQIERACNKIAKDTRRGKGNMLVVSTDVASALAMTGLLDYQGALTNNTNLAVDDTGNTFAGTLFGRLRVYVDPYSVTGKEFVVVGYKGSTPYDAGLFYCPYVPLQMVRAIDPVTYQPKIGFKTRYGMVANPFAQSEQNAATVATSGDLVSHANRYYRKFLVLNVAQ